MNINARSEESLSRTEMEIVETACYLVIIISSSVAFLEWLSICILPTAKDKCNGTSDMIAGLLGVLSAGISLTMYVLRRRAPNVAAVWSGRTAHTLFVLVGSCAIAVGSRIKMYLCMATFVAFILAISTWKFTSAGMIELPSLSDIRIDRGTNRYASVRTDTPEHEPTLEY